MKTGLNYLIPALKTTKEMSSICPQLQLALGVLLKILETYKVCVSIWRIRHFLSQHLYSYSSRTLTGILGSD